ncbi:MBL fold metallo-hydrolase [Actinopolyspora mortivallis]|uniref:MBL fold metallo-hydrolase n=1 Tax=Actinopolyspora mortivallis TaxID=33906 RepID=A0A2T0GS58_ACTMO|nr:MBL fold metallo-hydrolase [Actinopolyspora mortivallis]PRW61945.1 MBL fold metallo-hydrolase [Actinopolyspora mortivallis]
MSTPDIIRPAERTTVRLRLPGGWFHNNTGWIRGDDRVLLVDTCATETRTRHLLDGVRAEAGDLPLEAVLTHAHGDHANGAGQVERAGGTVHATPRTAEDVHNGPHTHPELLGELDWGNIAPPARIEPVPAARTLELGNAQVSLHPAPVRAHTAGDLVVHHERESVLFAGDLLFSGITPLALHGSIGGWIEALDWLSEFGAETLVPGHGPIPPVGEKLLAEQRAYLRWLLEHTTEDEPDHAALELCARERWPQWHDPERHAANLRLAHAENHGHEPDVTTAARAMLRSAGGHIAVSL